MYEVFLNDRRIVLPALSADKFVCCDLNPDWISDPVALQKVVDRFLEGDEKNVVLSGKTDWLWPQFRSLFTSVPAAGGIVHSEKGFLFIFRRGKWDLPKGKTDQNETAGEAALREVSEETGLRNLSITGSYPSTWHIYQSPQGSAKDQWILKETKWYFMSAEGNETPIPEISEDIEEIRWFQPEELDIVISNTYGSLENLVKSLRE